MYELFKWSSKWGIPYEALIELQTAFGTVDQSHIKNLGGKTETHISNELRIEACKKEGFLMRNNVGVAFNPDGRPVRFGLMNDSKQLNEKFKSSDLIGIMPHLVTREDVGKTIGQFTAVEVKKEGWAFTGTKRENAQLNFIKKIISLGGRAFFTNRSGAL